MSKFADLWDFLKFIRKLLISIESYGVGECQQRKDEDRISTSFPVPSSTFASSVSKSEKHTANPGFLGIGTFHVAMTTFYI